MNENRRSMRPLTEAEDSELLKVDTLEQDESDLAQRRCRPFKAGEKPLGDYDIRKLLQKVDLWWCTNGEIFKTFSFRGPQETFAFVTAIYWISQQQDHYPEVRFGRKSCQVGYSSFEVGGISENDFICAAKVDRLLKC